MSDTTQKNTPAPEAADPARDAGTPGEPEGASLFPDGWFDDDADGADEPAGAGPAAAAAADGGENPENPMIKKRWFGRGIYGSKDVPIRVLDGIIAAMIVAAVALTFWGATHNGFAINFNTGADDVTVPAQTVEHGEHIALPEEPLRPGYTLTGWSTTPAPEVRLWDFDANTVEGDMTLYAVWTAASFPVRFDLDGGTVDGEAEPDPITVTYGQPYGTLPTPEKEGAVFAGWTYSGQSITADTIVTMTGEHVLTAVWQ